MPPKVYKKPVRDESNQRIDTEDSNEKLPLSEKCIDLITLGDINLKFVA